MVPPRSPPASRFCSPSSLIHSVMRPTIGSSVGPNSVVDAFASPAILRAPSMQAICMPKPMPNKGTLLSHTHFTLAILPSLQIGRDHVSQHVTNVHTLC